MKVRTRDELKTLYKNKSPGQKAKIATIEILKLFVQLPFDYLDIIATEQQEFRFFAPMQGYRQSGRNRNKRKRSYMQPHINEQYEKEISPDPPPISPPCPNCRSIASTLTSGKLGKDKINVRTCTDCSKSWITP